MMGLKIQTDAIGDMKEVELKLLNAEKVISQSRAEINQIINKFYVLLENLNRE